MKTIERKIVTCEKCKGTGKLRVGNLMEMHNSDIDECHSCHGDGSYIIEITTERFRKTSSNVSALIPVA